MSTSSYHLPPYWQKALLQLSQKDKILGKLISQNPKLVLSSRGDAFQTLIRSVVGQQISVLAAASIWQRIEKGVAKISYQNFIHLPLEKTHSFGLSKQKTSYIQNIALHFKENNIKSHSYWQKKNYQEIFAELVQIKGIGKWTIEMFAIFYLLEPDIFPVKDLGLIRAINNLYSKDKPLSAEEIIALSEKWCPYRTAATFFLWRSIDADIVAY